LAAPLFYSIRFLLARERNIFYENANA